MKRMALALAWLSVAGAMVGFYQPWAMLDLREPALAKQLRDAAISGLEKRLGRITVTIRRGAETIAGDLPSLADLPTEISGAEIPRMIREERAQLALALAEIFTPYHGKPRPVPTSWNGVGRNGGSAPEGSPPKPPRMLRSAKQSVRGGTGFTNARYHLGLKSNAVYLIPGVALLCGVLLTIWGRRRPAIAWGVALFCGGIAGAGFWTLLTMKTPTHLVAVTVGWGLWLSCWAYVGLAAAAVLFRVAFTMRRACAIVKPAQ